MKCSEYVKSRGVKSLTFLSEKTGVPVTTLRDWYKTRRKAFDYLITGVLNTATLPIVKSFKNSDILFMNKSYPVNDTKIDGGEDEPRRKI